MHCYDISVRTLSDNVKCQILLESGDFSTIFIA